jgi:uncharacterized protein (DUF433 family)
MVKLGLCKEAVIRQWPDRIMIDPDIHHGEPCVRGTRIPVSMIVGSLADGMSFAQIEEQYPQLNDQDILASLAYAAEAVRQDVLLPLSG